MKTRYVHTNIIAKDWRRLAQFYCDVFGCTKKLPERDLRGNWLDSATGVNNARLQGIHLYLPGYGKKGPTLEIFQYSENIKKIFPAANREGFGHIAFQVEDVDECLKIIIENGGGMLGETVRTHIEGAGEIHFVYALDPEGNIVELQKWEGK